MFLFGASQKVLSTLSFCAGPTALVADVGLLAAMLAVVLAVAHAVPTLRAATTLALDTTPVGSTSVHQYRPAVTSEAVSERGGHFANLSSFTLYSEPVVLRFGQMFMSYEGTSGGGETQPLPEELIARYADGTVRMAIAGFEHNVVRRHANGTETSVPLHELYLHHGNVNVGEIESGTTTPTTTSLPSRTQTGDGPTADYRSDRWLEPPFRHLVMRPRSVYVRVHMINTHRLGVPFAGSLSPLSQCPCTPQRAINASGGTIDGVIPAPPFVNCPPALVAEQNPACTLATYQGGERCCARSGDFLIDTSECVQPGCTEYEQEEFYLRSTVYYEDEAADTRAVAKFQVNTAPNGEYDVVPCAAGTPDHDCVHVLSCVTPIGERSEYGMLQAGLLVDDPQAFDLARALVHLHSGALSMELQDAHTNQTVCLLSRENGGLQYGTGTAAGDEAGYLARTRQCSWTAASAPRFRRGHPLRTIATYDASVPLTGVMAQWTLTLAHVDI